MTDFVISTRSTRLSDISRVILIRDLSMCVMIAKRLPRAYYSLEARFDDESRLELRLIGLFMAGVAFLQRYYFGPFIAVCINMNPALESAGIQKWDLKRVAVTVACYLGTFQRVRQTLEAKTPRYYRVRL